MYNNAGTDISEKHTFHVLGMTFTATNSNFVAEANTNNIMAMCKLLMDMGHTVYHYGNYGSNPNCTEHFDILDQIQMEEIYNNKSEETSAGGYFIKETDQVKKSFIKRAIELVGDNKRAGDFLLGVRQPHDLVSMAHPDLIYVHHSVSHAGWSPKKAVYASHFIRNFVLAKEHIRTGSVAMWKATAVIPHFLDKNQFEPCYEPGDYCVFVGRLTGDKGLQIAIDACAQAGEKLLILGQGKIDEFEMKGDAEYVGFITSADERNSIVRKAKALIAPTQMPEPFGLMVIEAQMLGVPTITSDWGAFPETNPEGITGFRCSADHEYIDAISRIESIDRRQCRNHAVENFSESSVCDRYSSYFDRIFFMENNRDQANR